MERGSDKHSPMLDEQMRRETQPLTRGSPTEARAREEREAEPAGEDQPQADARVAAAGTPTGDPDDLEARSDLARFLRPSAFPAARDTLIATAGDEGAPEGMIAQLRGLPEGTEFANVEQVWESLGNPDPDPPRS